MRARKTVKPVEPGNFSGAQPEFGRTRDLDRLFGVKRGSAYNLAKAGKIRGVVLRIQGQKSGLRLWHLDSVRRYIHAEMERAGR